jgi:hypothetical protein
MGAVASSSGGRVMSKSDQVGLLPALPVAGYDGHRVRLEMIASDALKGGDIERAAMRLAPTIKSTNEFLRIIIVDYLTSLRSDGQAEVDTHDGIRRLGDVDKAHKTESVKKRISRAAKREIKDLQTIERFELLPNIEQLMVSTNRVVLHAIAQQAGVRPKAPKELEREEGRVASANESVGGEVPVDRYSK